MSSEAAAPDQSWPDVNDVKSVVVAVASVTQAYQNAPGMNYPNSLIKPEQSATSEGKSALPASDSGNCSLSSNASDSVCPLDMELHNHCQHAHTLLRERDQALFLAMQDVRKLRSELERLNKSEEWYKKELREQKSSRLEALERLYAQERKYMQENQRLQRECVRLYEKCGEMENELQAKQQKAVQQLVDNEWQQNRGKDADKEDNHFEVQQQRSLIDDQENLINVLRKQKQVLLEELKRLSEEKDTRVLELQETLASVEVENARMTAQCKRLLTERQVLAETLQTKDVLLIEKNAEKLKMQTLIEELKDKLNQQEQMLAQKEHEIQEMQRNFKRNMRYETNMDEVHRLSVSYHDEINAKTAGIVSLKKSLQAIQIELDALTVLQGDNDEQERQIEHLNFALETRQCELSNLQATNEEKTQHISELQQNLEKVRTQHDITIANLHTADSSLKSIKRELIALHEQYAAMCAVCERTRFQLELLEIEKSKLRFQADSDKREIEQLRGKLIGYLKHTEELGTRINELEAGLKRSGNEKDELQIKLRNLEKGGDGGKYQEIEMMVTQANLQSNRELTDLQNSENNTLRQHKEGEEDDSGFLDATKQFNSLSETDEGNNRELPDLRATKVTVSYSIKAANDILLGQLDTQKDILKERQTLIAAFEKLIDNTAPPVNKGHLMNECDELLERQEQLMEYLDCQGLLTLGKRQILEAFETAINGEGGPQKLSTNSQEISEMKKLIDENKKLKTLLTAVKEPLPEVDKKCADLEECVSNYSEQLQTLQGQLQENEEKNEANRSEQELLHKIQLQTNDGTIQRLHAENEHFKNELEIVLAGKRDIDSTIQKQKQLIQDLKTKLEAIEKLKNAHQILPFEHEELLNLRSKVVELEARLQAGDKERCSERVLLIRKLLEQQNTKMEKLTESQEEWEELLVALQTAQKLEENTRAELQLKNAELEELNALFAEQNEELRRLQEIAILANSNGNREEFCKLRDIFQQEKEETHAKLSIQLAESKEKQCKIDELEAKNERLERRLNEDYAEEVAKNQRQLRALQTKLENIQAERSSYIQHLAEMELELEQVKKSKREGLVLPPEFVILPQTAATTSNSDAATSSSSGTNTNLNHSDSDNNDRMRILTKVLEAEYRRKMKRYDLHIHTLLGNIKKLKKALRAAEQRAVHLEMKQSSMMEELHGVQLTRPQLEEMRLKCELNQETIKTLEYALENERKKFETSDLGKATSKREPAAPLLLHRDEPTHEVANLIDDYKKLIQQSALATQRPKTSAILYLIQRSNQCVPNLNKLETTVDGLRSDLEHFLSVHALQKSPQTQGTHKLDGPSLMDELRAATESH